MLDVRQSRELQAAILGVRRLQSELRPELYKEARSELGGEWVPELQRRVVTPLESRIILKGAAVRVNQSGFKMVAATSRRPLRNGLMPDIHWPGAEFGARAQRATYQRRSPRGTVHTVTRTVNRQFRTRSRDGRIAFDAASVIGTRLAGVWVRTLVTFVATKAEGEVIR